MPAGIPLGRSGWRHHPMNELRRILLLIETTSAYGRALLEGIGEYGDAHGGWRFYVEERGITDRPPAWLSNWEGDGIIFRSHSKFMLDAIQNCGVPAVDTNYKNSRHDHPSVYIDDEAVAEAAVNHFLERGFTNFGFCSVDNEQWVWKRCSSYLGALAAEGMSCHTWSLPDTKRNANWEQLLDDLCRWVSQLPKPIAIFAANDLSGIRLSDACRIGKIAVPDQVAILGADNDTTLNRFCSPPLSSVDPNASRIGYEAARLLDQLMSGEKPPQQQLLLPPAGVIARQSTDVTAINDSELALALTYIRQHACEGIAVSDVVKHLAVSRATLERRFASGLGCTPKQEIFRVRMKHVKRFLDNTDDGLAEIASHTGFGTPFHLSTAFKRSTGISPTAYRQSRRKSSTKFKTKKP
ncbi:AraC family transcriptional regulator [Neorhodopirellula lusitana]|uniref:AraC family transcriptional regulator n=1 Tax=Neorhodopirellula lusitana TaxID=445327 RepID=UPI0038509179